MIIFWLALFVILLIIEIITVGLTTIWFAGGSMAALIVAAVGGPVWLQVILFLVVSFVLLFFTRPWAVKYLNIKNANPRVSIFYHVFVTKLSLHEHFCLILCPGYIMSIRILTHSP